MANRKAFDVLVIGAGPAGIAAALAAAESGKCVGIVDENPHPGGQIYRGSATDPHPQVRRSILQLAERGVECLAQTTVFDAPAPGLLRAVIGVNAIDLAYDKLILATGARELFLPFPGWTLPNVMGVGGLQALVKGGLAVTGKRVVVAGSGPLLLAVAAYLKSHGAKVLAVAEQAPVVRLASFLLTLAKYPSKIRQGLELGSTIGGRIKPGAWVERAEGFDKLDSLKLNTTHDLIPCDFLACAFGFVPNIELPSVLGCELKDGFVAVDEFQQTSVANVYCAGEPTSLCGVDLSQIEGSIAGFAATGQTERAKSSFVLRADWTRFGAALDKTFAIRDEIKALATDETTVCRCEDVKLGQLRGFESAVAAKLHTRCGMGPCQGRICGPATRTLLGWEQMSVRPPIVPTPLGCLCEPTGTDGD